MIWRKFPKHAPKRKGWYQCTIQFPLTQDRLGETIFGTYVMDLYWDPVSKKFIDKRKEEMFDRYAIYEVIGNSYEQIDTIDDIDRTGDVTYWKRLPKPKKDPYTMYSESYGG